MYCIKEVIRTEEVIKKSRFIGIVIPCSSEQEIMHALNQLHQEFSDASHIVYAYRILTDKGFISRFSDAGEPSGTAGKPIFQHIEGKDLINVLIVVVRYFGGIKLGAGGLTRAYSNSAKKSLENSTLTPYVITVDLNVELDYKQMQPFEYQLKKLDGQIIEQNFSDVIQLKIRIPADQQHALPEFCSVTPI